MSCQTCEQDPCTCQKQLQAETHWIVRHCTTPGCFTAIRERVGQLGEPTCKWCQSGESHAMKGRPSVDPRVQGIEVP